MKTLSAIAMAITLQGTLALADLSSVNSVEVKGDRCTFKTEVDTAKQVVVLTLLGNPGSGSAARFEIPSSVLPLKDGARVSLSDALTEVGLSYQRGYLKLWKRDRTGFFESDSLGIQVDPNLQSPLRATLWDGINYIPLHITKCSF